METKTAKTVVVAGRCTVFEREAIVTRARRSNKSLSEYLIGCALSFTEFPTTRPDGRSINKLTGAKLAEQGQAKPPSYLHSSDGNGGA